MKARWAVLALLAAAAGSAVPGQAPQDPVVAAMRDELRRSMAQLRIEGQPAPYYIAYQIDDTSGRRLTARLGEVGDEGAGRSRALRVEVRVGDYQFDSSRFIGAGSGVDMTAAVLDDDYEVLRRQLWLLTDAAYKRALNVYARKRATFQNRNAEDAIADFARVPPVERTLPSPLPAADWNEWQQRARQMSAVFVAYPGIQSAEVNLVEERGRRYYVNSEGFAVISPIGVNGLRVLAETQAADGAPVRDFFEVFERTLADAQPADVLLARTRELAARVDAARAAKTGEDFHGPVLFEGQAGAELTAQVLVPLLLATRAPDNERGTQGAPPPWLSRIGARVMAEDLAVSDTPSLALFEGRPVPGAYELDDEGVPAQDVKLVENGRLLTLLTSRVPQRGLPESNGHGRGGGVQAGVVQLSSAAAMPAAELKAKYLALLKDQGRPFGYIVRSMAPPAALTGSVIDAAQLLALLGGGAQGAGAPGGPLLTHLVRVRPDGSEELVRGMRFGTLGQGIFRDVIGASEERVLHNVRPGTQSQSPGALGVRQLAVSVIAPGLIVDELEIVPTRDVTQKPPAVASPLAR